MKSRNIILCSIILCVTVGFAAQKQKLSECTLTSSIIDCTKNNIRISKERIDKLIEKKCYDYYKEKM
ncbi:MAG TPA: hypothetical protein PKC21_09180 [Oligoflexia bacterium]|nr:hypothetical protein [Oligoflexia bacterium]HMR25510.1 hypothetical protein [Oligoflexia bacterium]